MALIKTGKIAKIASDGTITYIYPQKPITKEPTSPPKDLSK